MTEVPPPRTKFLLVFPLHPPPRVTFTIAFPLSSPLRINAGTRRYSLTSFGEPSSSAVENDGDASSKDDGRSI